MQIQIHEIKDDEWEREREREKANQVRMRARGNGLELCKSSVESRNRKKLEAFGSKEAELCKKRK